jgi:hypothetical protein
MVRSAFASVEVDLQPVILLTQRKYVCSTISASYTREPLSSRSLSRLRSVVEGSLLALADTACPVPYALLVDGLG